MKTNVRSSLVDPRGGGRGAWSRSGRERGAFQRLPARSSHGFTLIEILIATSILTLGLVGILALFPVAIQAGRQVVEDSNAVVIAQSVAEAIQTGVRNGKAYSKSEHMYFVFAHDGVSDPVPADASLGQPQHDYYILLPRFSDGTRFEGATEAERRRRALQAGKTFVYPESDLRPPNGAGNAARADDDGREVVVRSGERAYTTYRVDRVYRLGERLLPSTVRERFESRRSRSSGSESYEELQALLADPRVLPDVTVEVLKQYSYAFAIRPSFYDADLLEARSFEPANQLYHVTVMVFRGLAADANGFLPKGQPSPTPVYELEFEVSL